MPNSGYDELGRKAGQLALRYQGGDKTVEGKLFHATKDLVYGFLNRKVLESRQTLTGVPGYIDAEDIFTDVMDAIFRVLGNAAYSDKQKYKSWVLRISYNKFLDSLLGRKGEARQEGEGGAISIEDAIEKSGDSEGRRRKGGVPAVPDDIPNKLIIREIMNLVLSGLSDVKNQDHANIFVARVILGKTEQQVCEIFDISPAMAKTNHRRACQKILKSIETNKDYPKVSLKGIQKLCEELLVLKRKDLDLIDDETARKALCAAAGKHSSLEDLSEVLGLPIEKSLAILRRGIAALSRAKMTRAQQGRPLDEVAKDAFVWEAVDRAIASYPRAMARTRNVSYPDDVEEAVALCSISVYLAYAGGGDEPCTSLGQLLSKRVSPEEVPGVAKDLKLDSHKVWQLLSDTLPEEEMTENLLKRIERKIGIERDAIEAALSASQVVGKRLPTRSLSQEAEKRYLAGPTSSSYCNT
ncbi:MAG: hypothetical protein CO113_04135 [Elusimicrobia bacterium CG_4_9_14_3_um_filter_62_55]|nr:MAG: hypothetical protein CO113_04135 [Elusimicrobia bacterium CG_4_9_14_3_um_filter_62_55]